MTIKVIYRKEDWEALATCIRSEQVPADQLSLIFNENQDFAEWYKKEYMNDDN